ncbi:MAG: acyl-CoA dehydratase activase, partial [Desulfotomaculaceae bacterium]
MSEYYAGVDIGSLTVKVVIIDETAKIIGSNVKRAGFRGKETAGELRQDILDKANIASNQIAATVATGYGRLAFPADKEVSEISCQAKGIAHLFPQVRTIIDIGGQDSKVIKIAKNGRIMDFTMNDKCAAGTGRFLEVMAHALEIDVEDIGKLALSATDVCPISSTCTVFAESEVISHIAQGASRPSIVAGICQSIAERVYSLAKRIDPEPAILLTGGVALNEGVVKAVSKSFGEDILVPPSP